MQRSGLKAQGREKNQILSVIVNLAPLTLIYHSSFILNAEGSIFLTCVILLLDFSRLLSIIQTISPCLVPCALRLFLFPFHQTYKNIIQICTWFIRAYFPDYFSRTSGNDYCSVINKNNPPAIQGLIHIMCCNKNRYPVF